MIRLLDLFLPPKCPVCRAVRGPADRGQLCSACAAEIRRTYRAEGGKPVEGCTQTDAALLYTGAVRRMILHTKNGGLSARPWLCGQTAALLLSHQAAWRPDFVTFVPTALNHWWKRGFNLGADLAQGAAKACGLPCRCVLRRRLFGGYQSHSSDLAARRRRAAAAYSPGKGVRLDGMRVVLVDDVLTSGATASACARLLREMGAVEVYFLCVAKTPDRRMKMTKNSGKCAP